MTVNMAADLEDPFANGGGTRLEAVTKDQLNTGLTGQIRYRVSESNLYAFLFGIKKPFVHVMAYFVSVLRQRIANFEARNETDTASNEMIGVSINDLRKNLRDLNDYMESECRSAQARYGVVFDASLITAIDPPNEVESALAAINTAHNQVSSDISLAQASADQKIVQSKRAVEIETLKAQAEVAPVKSLAEELSVQHKAGPGVLAAYLRNVKLGLLEKHSKSIWRQANEFLRRDPFYSPHLLRARRAASVVFRVLGLYAIVNEGTCRVYVLFGKVIGVLG
jgi:cell division protein FtsB